MYIQDEPHTKYVALDDCASVVDLPMYIGAVVVAAAECSILTVLPLGNFGRSPKVEHLKPAMRRDRQMRPMPTRPG